MRIKTKVHKSRAQRALEAEVQALLVQGRGFPTEDDHPADHDEDEEDDDETVH